MQKFQSIRGLDEIQVSLLRIRASLPDVLNFLWHYRWSQDWLPVCKPFEISTLHTTLHGRAIARSTPFSASAICARLAPALAAQVAPHFANVLTADAFLAVLIGILTFIALPTSCSEAEQEYKCRAPTQSPGCHRT